MGLNKFITKKGRVLLDLTEDTVTPETLGKGVTAHDRSGEPIVGTMEGGGECSGNHIIEVDELPTENIDETALYKVGDSYYKYRNVPFSDLILGFYGSVLVFSELAAAQGYEYSFNTIPTKTTENIKVSDGQSNWHWYYVQDENDVLFYGDMEGTGTNAWLPCAAVGFGAFGGFVSDVSEVTGDGYYALGYAGFVNYIVPKGSVTITENSIVDVTDKKSVIVDVPQPSGTKYIYQNGTYDVADYQSAEISVPVPDGYIKPSGTITISQNGTHDVTSKASAKVSVPTTYVVQSVEDLPSAPVGSIAYVLGGE
jgi:hypothetical protein